MTNQETLTLEIVKHIFGILGFTNPFISNLVGINFTKFNTSKIKIEYEEIGNKNFPIYSGKISNQSGSVVRVLAVCLEDLEFFAIIRCDDGPVFGIKLLSNESLGSILVAKVEKNWTKTSISEQLILCTGFELLNDSGAVWKPEPIEQFLHTCLLEFVESSP